MSCGFCKFFLVILGFLLLGYAFLGRGFAYLGISPIYVGEIVLAIGLLTAIMSGGVGPALRSPITSWLLVLMFWGAIRTVPYIDKYGMDALRDAVIWGYGMFAILVANALLRSGWLFSIIPWYSRLSFWWLLWLPVAITMQLLANSSIPIVAETDFGTIGIILLKMQDISTHLGGVAAFLLLGLQHVSLGSKGRFSWLKDVVFWIAWSLSAIIAASLCRGGLLAMVAAISVTLFFQGRQGWRRAALFAGCIALLVITVNYGDIAVDLGTDRDIAFRQIFNNVESVFTHRAATINLANNREWRLKVWSTILDYTLFGNYFWMGKGYGINLADDAGFAIDSAHSLRSPHNAHVTILARSGVPGLLIWIILQGAFAVSMLGAYFRAKRSGQKELARVNLFILAYWLAFVVNGSFDVFLEGPQAGIWFWSLFGVGIALLEKQRVSRYSKSTGRKIKL